MSIGRHMTVVRLDDGELLVHNPIVLDDAGMEQLGSLGRVAWIVVPSGYHRLDAAAFSALHPEARILCPEGARERVEQKVTVHGGYGDLPEQEGVWLEHLEGCKRREGVLGVRRGGKVTLVFCDMVFNLPHSSGLSGWLVRLLGSSGGPRVTPTAKFVLVDDKPAVRANLERLADTPGLDRVFVAHRKMVEDDPAGVLREAASTLG